VIDEGEESSKTEKQEKYERKASDESVYYEKRRD
jgi:hypothetical protein